MTEQIATTPFGRRPVTLGQIAARMQVRQTIEQAALPGSNVPAAINKWALFRTLTEIKERVGLSDRSLSVLNALLSFHQETALTLPAATPEVEEGSASGAPSAAPCDLIVFPSNKALALRAHGMSEATLRRHLAALVAAGMIARRDSPNGKRYARKDLTGQDRFSDAFGFDLTPLVARAAEFEAIAEEFRAERREIKGLKERITLHRRDIAKLIQCGVDEEISAPWPEFTRRFMGLLTPLRQIRGRSVCADLEDALAQLRRDVSNILEHHAKKEILSGNDARNDQHLSNSKSQFPIFEPAPKEARGEIEPKSEPDTPPGPEAIPLGMALDACPDLATFQFDGERIGSWPAFEALARTVRPFLGISPDAWNEAVDALGERNAAIAVAAILQRSEHSSEIDPGPGAGGRLTVQGSPAIRSPGGYLRALTEQARAGTFSLGPILMSLIGQRLKAKRTARGNE